VLQFGGALSYCGVYDMSTFCYYLISFLYVPSFKLSVRADIIVIAMTKLRGNIAEKKGVGVVVEFVYKMCTRSSFSI